MVCFSLIALFSSDLWPVHAPLIRSLSQLVSSCDCTNDEMSQSPNYDHADCIHVAAYSKTCRDQVKRSWYRLLVSQVLTMSPNPGTTSNLNGKNPILMAECVYVNSALGEY